MIYEILGIASMGAMLQNFKLWQDMLEGTFLNVKPFNCTLCWTFWMSVLPNIDVHGPKGIYISCIEAVAAELIDRQLNKY